MPTSLRSEKEILSGWGEYSTPLVSICCITYNHSEFVKDAFDGFLMQKTKFSFEIIVFDDASTDETQRIILDYIKEYPKLFVPFLQKENLWQNKGISGTFTIAFPNARGKYIAWCEGDDYWTDPLKLQKQVDFLEANPDFAICFHKVKIWEKGQLKDEYITSVPSVSTTILDLAKGNYIHTPSCLFRNNTAKILGENFHASLLGDYYIHIMNAQYGNIFYIDEAMAVYRVHSNSTFSSQSRTYRIAKTLEAIEAIYKDLQIQEVEVRQQLIDTHIRCTIYIYDQLLLTTDLKNTIATFYPHEYRLRLIGNLIDSEEKTKNLENKLESIRWLTRILASRIKKRIFKLFTQKETST